jgi:hypothetical protein
MKVEEYKRIATVADHSHGSPLTRERGWACLPVGRGDVFNSKGSDDFINIIPLLHSIFYIYHVTSP